MWKRLKSGGGRQKEPILSEREIIEDAAFRSAIVIPCFDRLDDLRIVLNELSETTQSFDIHVYDDFSPHTKIQELCANYPRITYHRSIRNRGVIGIRNLAMSELRDRYKYIFHFDDDSYPVRRDTLQVAVNFMEANADVAVLSFPIISPGEVYSGDGEMDIFTYVGCGNVWRSAASYQIGLFSSLFYRQGEEVEHSFRVWKSGFRVVRLNAHPVVHWQSNRNRDNRKILALTSTAYLKWTVVNWKGILLWVEMSRWIAFTGRRLLKISWSVWFQDISDPQRGVRAAIKLRAPVPDERVGHVRSLYLAYRNSNK
jgi:GT2 family glycosyltransferase